MSGEIPARIGPYKIASLLGEGGMGRVYRATHKGLGREVALKVLSHHLCDRPDFTARFLREARAAASLTHPNVITCYDVGQAGDIYYMALELVTGGDASMLMKRRRGSLPEAEALAIARDVSAGLEAIETAGLLHRDIKPSNIFLDGRGIAKLADLGLARQATGDDQLTQAGAPLGTPSYMAPEQAQAISDLDIRADIFALGATLFCMITGNPPFLADNPMATLARLMSEPAPDIRKIRPELRTATVELINRCLAKERIDRFPHARDLHQAVNAALVGLAKPPADGPINRVESAPIRKTTTNAVRQGATPPPPTPSAKPEHDGPSSERLANRNSAKAEGALHGDIMGLVKRVHVAPDRMEAWINLASNTCFPSELLRSVLIRAKVVVGIDQSAVTQASRKTQHARRLVVARGEAPLPDTPGRNVYGDEVPPSAANIIVQVAPDAMEAWALFRPGQLVDRGESERAVRSADLRFGFDIAALNRLWDGPPDESGRAIIARGLSPDPGRPAGFRLSGKVTGGGGNGINNLARVSKGQELARWEPAVAAKNGMDVFGRVLPVSQPAQIDLAQMVGEGVRLSRGERGVQIILADRDGVCQQQVDGRIRVISAIEISGDVGPDSGPVSTDDVVVVRGSVLPGAKISSTNDVVVMGDLNDAEIEAGGSLEVHGDINPGQGKVVSGDTLTVAGTVSRKVIGGNLRINGEVRNCELVATGDIEVKRVVGGSLTAGGSIRVEHAGDASGVTTELWAGHIAGGEERNEVARMAERRLAAECRKISERYQAKGQDLVRIKSRFKLFENADWTNEDAMRQARQELERSSRELEQVDAVAAEARERLAKHRANLTALRSQADNADAVIEAKVVAHKGTVACLADADPVVVHADRIAFKLSL